MKVDMGVSPHAGDTAHLSTHIFLRGDITVCARKLQRYYYLNVTGKGLDLTFSTDEEISISKFCQVIGWAGQLLADQEKLEQEMAETDTNLNMIGALA